MCVYIYMYIYIYIYVCIYIYIYICSMVVRYLAQFDPGSLAALPVAECKRSRSWPAGAPRRRPAASALLAPALRQDGVTCSVSACEPFNPSPSLSLSLQTPYHTHARADLHVGTREWSIPYLGESIHTLSRGLLPPHPLSTF